MWAGDWLCVGVCLPRPLRYVWLDWTGHTHIRREGKAQVRLSVHVLASDSGRGWLGWSKSMFYILTRGDPIQIQLQGRRSHNRTRRRRWNCQGKGINCMACALLLLLFLARVAKHFYKQNWMPKFHKLLRNFEAQHKINKHVAFGIHVV